MIPESIRTNNKEITLKDEKKFAFLQLDKKELEDKYLKLSDEHYNLKKESNLLENKLCKVQSRLIKLSEDHQKTCPKSQRCPETVVLLQENESKILRLENINKILNNKCKLLQIQLKDKSKKRISSGRINRCKSESKDSLTKEKLKLEETTLLKEKEKEVSRLENELLETQRTTQEQIAQLEEALALRNEINHMVQKTKENVEIIRLKREGMVLHHELLATQKKCEFLQKEMDNIKELLSMAQNENEILQTQLLKPTKIQEALEQFKINTNNKSNIERSSNNSLLCVHNLEKATMTDESIENLEIRWNQQSSEKITTMEISLGEPKFDYDLLNTNKKESLEFSNISQVHNQWLEFQNSFQDQFTNFPKIINQMNKLLNLFDNESNKSENNLANNQSKFTNGESENLIFHLEEATKQLESSKDLLRMQNERNQQYRQEMLEQLNFLQTQTIENINTTKIPPVPAIRRKVIENQKSFILTENINNDDDEQTLPVHNISPPKPKERKFENKQKIDKLLYEQEQISIQMVNITNNLEETTEPIIKQNIIPKEDKSQISSSSNSSIKGEMKTENLPKNINDKRNSINKGSNKKETKFDEVSLYFRSPSIDACMNLSNEEIVINLISLELNEIFMKNFHDIENFFFEYSFFGLRGPELETKSFVLNNKSNKNKIIIPINFRRTFLISSLPKSSRTIRLIESNENFSEMYQKIRFSLRDESDKNEIFQEIAYADLDLVKVCHRKRSKASYLLNILHKDLTESVGNLAISIYGLFKLKEIIKGNFNEMIHHICIKNN